MKTLIKSVAVTVIVSVISFAADAQQEKNGLNFPEAHFTANFPELLRVASEPTGIRSKRNKFFSSFPLDFPNAQNVQWTTYNNIYSATFMIDDLVTRAVYNTAGIFSYAVTNYPTDRLPTHILKSVSRNYKSYQIFSATELKAYGSRAFHIILENNNSYLTVKITNNSIEELKKLKKSEDGLQ